MPPRPHALPPLAALLFAALALAPRPALAGRASACKEPPFAVPRETQRAVDAAIDARVTGTGAGSVSSNVETRTDYDTTTLSQDDAARAWTAYTLCLKLAKKLISQELHDELLRTLVAPQAATVTVAPAGPAPAAPEPAEPVAPPSDPAVLAGTWQVSSRFDWTSCPAGNVGGNDAYLWLISTTPTGEVVVTVQGRTNFDQLRGTWSDGRLRAGGVRQHEGEPVVSELGKAPDGTPLVALTRADVDLRLDGEALVGAREVAWGVTQPSEDGATTLYMPCVVRYEIRAHR